MYWRVRNLGPQHLIRQYGVHALLLASLFFNLVLFISRPFQATKVTTQQKVDFEEMAKRVVNQLLDTSYINYANNTDLLINGVELTNGLIRKMQASGQLPKNVEEVKANIRSLTREKTVVSVRIDSVQSSDPIGQAGLIPVDVAGTVARHSANGADESPFHLRLIMGLVATGQTNKDNTNKYSRFAFAHGAQQATAPIVTEIQEVTTLNNEMSN